MLTIAIDYDQTWTADPELWRMFAETAKNRGHKVIIATGRTQWSADMDRGEIPSWIKVVFCGPVLKEAATKKKGFKVDIWVDDMPGMIQDCKILFTEGNDDDL